MNAPYEPVHGLHSRADLAIHAAAGVEKNANADGHILVLAEMRDLLRLPVFFENEIVLGEIRDIPSSRVGDCRDDIDQSNIDANLCGENRGQSNECSKEDKSLKPAS